jgi:hypothetical protein
MHNLQENADDSCKTQKIESTLPFYQILPDFQKLTLFGMYPGFAHFSFWYKQHAYEDEYGELQKYWERNSGVPRGGRGKSPRQKNSEVLTKLKRIQFHGKYIRNNLIRIRVSLICKLSATPD